MRFRLTFLGIFLTILTFTSVYAQDWRKNPLTSTTSNYWRTLPYTEKTSNVWRSSPLSAKQSESKLRWNKNRWKISSMNWRNRPDIKKTLDSSSWKNRWDKRKWRNNPLNWRNSELRYKNTIKKYESASVSRKVKVWVVSDIESDKTPVSGEKKEYLKPQIETLGKDEKKISEETTDNLEQAENYFVLYSSEGSFRISKKVQK
jgi:hypothetical protein